MNETWPADPAPAFNLAAILFPAIIVGLLSYIYLCTCLMIIARKTGDTAPGLAWIPLVNLYTLVKAAGKSPAWLLLLLVPLVNLIVLILLWCAVAERRGKPWAAGFLLLIPVLGMLVLAWLAAGPAVNVAGAAPPVNRAPPAQHGSPTPSQSTSHAQAPRSQGPARPAANFCSNCGTRAVAGDRFCSSCGQTLQAAAPAATAAYLPPQPAPAAAPRNNVGTVIAIVAVVVILGIAAVAVGGFMLWNRVTAPNTAEAPPPANTTFQFPPSPPAPPPDGSQQHFPSLEPPPQVAIDVQPDGSTVYSGPGAIEKAIFDTLQAEIDKINKENQNAQPPQSPPQPKN